MSALANFWSWLTGGTPLIAKEDLPDDPALAAWIEAFPHVDDANLRAAIDAEELLSQRPSGARTQLTSKIIKWRRLNRAKHASNSLDNAIGGTGLSYSMEYAGDGNFTLHISGIDPKADAAING